MAAILIHFEGELKTPIRVPRDLRNVSVVHSWTILRIQNEGSSGSSLQTLINELISKDPGRACQPFPAATWHFWLKSHLGSRPPEDPHLNVAALRRRGVAADFLFGHGRRSCLLGQYVSA